LSHGAKAPRELWSRQADVLRAYDGLKDNKEQFPAYVAIELPTGAGKALVGCLIAEWRRRKYEETVAYVAPTRQLAQQAAAKAGLYGIPEVDLTGLRIQDIDLHRVPLSRIRRMRHSDPPPGTDPVPHLPRVDPRHRHIVPLEADVQQTPPPE
jgi:hypothetical protein